MNKFKILVPAFIIMVLVQLWVPAKMIWDQEDAIKNGVAYRFRTQPIDPTDPFRGKYITLDYKDVYVKAELTYEEMRKAKYVTITVDSDGFARPDAVFVKKPQQGVYLKVENVHSSYTDDDDDNTYIVEYPFTKFFMNEYKAYNAEKAYNEANRNTTNTSYAVVMIKDDLAVLRDVIINGKSATEVERSKN